MWFIVQCIRVNKVGGHTKGVKINYFLGNVAQYEHFVKILGWSEYCIRWKSFSVYRQNLNFGWRSMTPIPNFLCYSFRGLQLAAAVKGVFRGGVSPPWTSEIYWLQGVFRPQRVLSPPWKDKKIKPPSWTNSWIRP